MTLRFFSTAKRPPHLGPYPLERLVRGPMPDLNQMTPMEELPFSKPDRPQSIVNAMTEHQATMDALRGGVVNPTLSRIPECPEERARHLKSFGYFCDASMVGIAPLLPEAHLEQPKSNPDIDQLAEELDTKKVKSLASGVDMIMADLKECLTTLRRGIDDHHTAIVFLYEMPRDPRPGEAGYDWLVGAQAHRACLRSSETAVVIAAYLRLLGWDAKAHTATSTEFDLDRLAVSAGLAHIVEGRPSNPFVGSRFGVAAVTTTLDLAHDEPLAPPEQQGWLRTRAPLWWIGARTAKSAFARDPFANRDFELGPHPFETIKRVDAPTTYIDEVNVARVPKRTDMFARAQFGDLGKAVKDEAEGGRFVQKAAPSMAQRGLLGAFMLFQDGQPAAEKTENAAKQNAANVKAASYFLGIDAVGLSRCPEWAWYSHDAAGQPIDPSHDQAISMIVDQGFETMEGASGDDWISVAQSMRAYLRFSLLGGVIARQIRNLGYNAKAHTVMDGEVLQPPLLLLSGLGEVSRIGEVILNPFLGPRLKSGVITTDMPLAHDKPIDFGLQRFCESCNKCARECPSGAITAGPKLMFNGYEIWKSDSQKCATYRITTQGGSMCGRCMKTCPWNLEGLFAEKPFRWAASNVPAAAPVLARLDDALGHGGLNPVKKWWWDIELADDGAYHPTTNTVNVRHLQRDLRLRYEDQTLAVYPAPLAPPPWPYPFPMDREAGIKAYGAMVPAQVYRAKKAAGETGAWAHEYKINGQSPVLDCVVEKVEPLTSDVSLFTFARAGGAPFPKWQAGAHVDVVITPDKLRQYSIVSDPADPNLLQIAVLREAHGKGGSVLLHRLFREGRRVFLSNPINHFPLSQDADYSYLMGGGIGITPMIAMAHELHMADLPFELHYSVSRSRDGAFLDLLRSVPWANRAHCHVSDDGSRLELSTVFSCGRGKTHVYTCGPDAYMTAVHEAAAAAGVAEDAFHREYFVVPDAPERESFPFTLVLRDGRQISVAADQSAAEALTEAGIHVDVKCADGLCGVCKCGVLDGDVDHRDLVLSARDRKTHMITCQSRAIEPGGEITLDL